MIAYDDEGSGVALVLLHSGSCDRRMWKAQAAVLASSYRVVRPDLRGFGQTPLPFDAYSFAADVVALLDHLAVERAAFVGSSLGGGVALELAARSPERVISLVLLCPAFRGVGRTPAADAFAAEEDQLLTSGDMDAAVELNVSTWLGPEAAEECRDFVREMQRHSLEMQLAAESRKQAPRPTPVEVELRRISVPTLVVSGGRDMDHFQYVAKHLAGSIPGARLQHLAWAAHLPSLERPDEITDLISDYLAITTAE
jgi:pimeloyl-ACP methyl ester carboxylesterase